MDPSLIRNPPLTTTTSRITTKVPPNRKEEEEEAVLPAPPAVLAPSLELIRTIHLNLPADSAPRASHYSVSSTVT